MGKLLVVAALVLAGVVLAARPEVARAQESPIDFLMNQSRQAEEARRRAAQRRAAEEAARAAQQQQRARQQAERALAERRRQGLDLPDASARVVELPKAPDARAILVIGDEMAEGLAQGLREMLAGEPGVTVRHRATHGTGLTREGVDWLALVRAAAREENPVAIVVMLGVWDRGALTDGAQVADRLSERWRALYGARVDALLAAAPTRDTPVFWVGLPIMRAAELTAEATSLNDVLKQRVFAAGQRFVDGWDGFVDENGRYVAVGPDVSGAPRRLRRPDGVGLTPAGNRKLALFVDTEIRRLIDFGVFSGGRMVDAPAAPAMPAAPADTQPTEAPVARPFVGAPAQLTPAVATRGGELGVLPAATGPDLGQRILRAGETLAPRPGRADDHRWPPPGAPSPEQRGADANPLPQDR
jgi:hypothetical protein